MKRGWVYLTSNNLSHTNCLDHIWDEVKIMLDIYSFIYFYFIYRWQYIKTHDLKVQLNCIAVQIIRYMHAN